MSVAEDTPRAAIGAYLAESPVESFRVQPDAVSDDPRDDLYVVLDVRSRDEFANGRIAGAINVPYQEVVGHLDALPAGPDDPVLIYCETMTRSTQALMALRLLGYRPGPAIKACRTVPRICVMGKVPAGSRAGAGTPAWMSGSL